MHAETLHDLAPFHRRTGGQDGRHCWSCRKEWSSSGRPAPRHLLSSSPGFQGRSRRSSSVKMMISGVSPPTALRLSIPLCLVIEHHADVGSWSNPELHHMMIPLPDFG